MVMSKIKKLFLVFILCPIGLCAQGKDWDTESFINGELRVRSAEWIPKIAKQYGDGSPEIVIFYERDDLDVERAVKRMRFYEGGALFEETDLIEVDEGSIGYQIWKNRIVPHGVSVQLRTSGEIERWSTFDEGLLHGVMKTFHPKGALEEISYFNRGKPEGKRSVYYESGQLALECDYENGLLHGSSISYYSNGEKKALIPYVSGKIQGRVVQWDEKGNERMRCHYFEGALHSANNQSAVTCYDEKHTTIEIKDYDRGILHGDHIQYYPNARQKYHVRYVQGKKEGKEHWYTCAGEIMGEGEYLQGKKIGKHWKNHDNGALGLIAIYDKKGHLKEPVQEFDETGKKRAEYWTNEEGTLHGKYQSWFPNGALQVDAWYVEGQLDRNYAEYFSSGKIKCRGRYANRLKEGLFQEWNEEGTLIFQEAFKEGVPNGEQERWFPNGVLSQEGSYAMGKKEGMFRSWTEGGILLFEGAFKEDQPVGPHRTHYDSGKLLEVFHFSEGKKEGKHQKYYENGQIQLDETFKNDRLDGTLYGYFEDGTKAFERKTKEGRFIGIQKTFYPAQDRQKEEDRLASLASYNEKGELHGQQKCYYRNGAIKTLVTYENGILHGFKGFWDEEGTLLEESKYIHGKLEGRYFEKDREGRESLYHYKNNKKEGSHIIYYPLDLTGGEKVKAIEATYQNNQIQGIVSEYDPSGKKIGETSYRNGKKEGVSQMFHTNGRIALRIHFKGGLKDGPFHHYYPNGKLYKEIGFSQDQKDGEEKTFFQNGQLKSIYPYCKGQLNGKAQQWNESGVLIFEADYRDGKEHGRFVKYDGAGKIRLEQFFVNGKLDGVKTRYDADGNGTTTLYKDGERVVQES